MEACVGEWVVVLRPDDIGRLLLARHDVELPLFEYERDLGMPTEAALLKQLDIDLPRSIVRLRGERVRSAARVVDAMRAPRLCTQAALAPVVEFLLHAGVIAHELPEPRGPCVADVDGPSTVVRKRLGLRDWDGVALGAATVTLLADERRCTLTASLRA